MIQSPQLGQVRPLLPILHHKSVRDARQVPPPTLAVASWGVNPLRQGTHSGIWCQEWPCSYFSYLTALQSTCCSKGGMQLTCGARCSCWPCSKHHGQNPEAAERQSWVCLAMAWYS